MGFALLIIGVILAGTGIRGTQGTLAGLLASDFSGAGSFWFWIVGLFLAGSIGYYQPMREVSRLLIGLILLVLFLSNQGFWAKLIAQTNAPRASSAPGLAPVPSPVVAGAQGNPIASAAEIVKNPAAAFTGGAVQSGPATVAGGLSLTDAFSGVASSITGALGAVNSGGTPTYGSAP